MDQVLLSGPPGVGKTTVGRILARSLEVAFFDLDQDMSSSQGQTPAEILRVRGEAELRRLEEKRLGELPRGPAVIALGGGTLTAKASRRLARERGIVVGLRASAQVLEARLRADPTERPLLEGGGGLEEELHQLLATRSTSYEAVDRVFEAESGPELVAERIRSQLTELEVSICKVGPTRTRILVGRGLSVAASGAVSNLAPERPIIALMDAGVPEEARHRYLEPLRRHHRVFERVLVGGEEVKTWAVLQDVVESALDAGAGRQSVVFAMGGGAVLDLAGLVAALIGRGAPLVLVPSTLLAQVDASVGGKCAINTGAGRNLVGAFHPASDVIIDLELLRSLPARDLRSGLAEVVKMGLIADADLFRSVRPDSWQDPKTVSRALALKAEIVERDPYEHGDRRLLNLGHSLGHAVEAESGYQLRHGEAVALGIAWIADFSTRRAGLSEAERAEVVQTLANLGLPVAFGALPWGRLRSYIFADKKGDSDGIDLIVLPKIGEARPCRVSWDELDREFVLQGG